MANSEERNHTYAEFRINFRHILPSFGQLEGTRLVIEKSNREFNPTIALMWNDPVEVSLQIKQIYHSYSLVFEIHKVTTESIRGALYFATPDSESSFVSGQFEAEIR